MAEHPVTAAPETSLREAAKRMVDGKIGCLPVIEPDGTLVGLVTETDLLRAALLEEAREESAES